MITAPSLVEVLKRGLGGRGAAAAPVCGNTERVTKPSAGLLRAIAVAAVLAGVGVAVMVLASDHQEAKAAFAIFGPAVGWGFIGTRPVGVAARARRTRPGGCSWRSASPGCCRRSSPSNNALVYTIGLIVGALWGSFFLHLGMTFPSGEIDTRLDRAIVIAGYFVFPLAFVPGLLFAAPQDLDCPECPTNVLLIEPRRGPGVGPARARARCSTARCS